MGIYLNPGNSGFQEIRNSRYVDKSGMIRLVNQVIGTKQKLICVSRPRRFGKSFAAQMLCAYYDRSCDSSALFDDLAIATDKNLNGSYLQHLNKYDVIYLDMTNILGKVKPQNVLPFIEKSVTAELLKAYPGLESGNTFDETLIAATKMTGSRFIMIIDEWDAPIRETPELQKEYLHFLRMLFKSSGTTDKIFAAAYMTGILPIKKDGSQSAISDFEEFSMLDPGKFGRYIGFTEDEVARLCRETGCDFAMMKHWYDGYIFPDVGSVYNSNSVMKAVRRGRYESYWTQTSAADSLLGYISLDFDGLSGVVAELIGGGKTKVSTKKFSNDLVTFHSRDDVLTLLIHLGYLTYDEKTQLTWIPNEEIKMEFGSTVRDVKRDETIRRVRESDQLIADTVHGNADAVAAQIEKIHAEEAPLHYNNEQSLRSVVKRAYFSYGDEYVLFEELPAGEGFADIVYLPKKDSLLPALLIELKWNRSAQGAISQIKEKHYPEALKDYGGNLLLVAVAYDKEAPAGKRKHTCIIEQG
ncbi:MAG: ATP-binding protein [bacterium]|nr:ATP-binding protein [bacterium]